MKNRRPLSQKNQLASPEPPWNCCCLNDACRHTALIDVSNYPDDAEVSSFARKVVCAKCGARERHIEVRPNWKEQPAQPSLTGKVWR